MADSKLKTKKPELYPDLFFAMIFANGRFESLRKHPKFKNASDLTESTDVDVN